jgi:hypothetical protein
MHKSTTRHRGRAITGFAAAVAAVGMAAGCGDDDKSSAKPKAFAITATASGKAKAITFPKTVEAGLVSITLRNTDKVPRSAQIIRIEGAHNTDSVLKLLESDEPQKIPDFIKDGGGVATVKPGETGTVTQNLAPGKYIVWDDQGGDGQGGGAENWEFGAKGDFTVTGDTSDDELPSVPATIIATDKGDKDYGFELKGLKAGTNQVRFENTGKQLHHALLFPLLKGSTADDFKAFIKSDGKGRPPVDFEHGVGTSVIDSGIAQNVELDLKAGDYAVICFLSDRDGEKKSHADKGMIESLTVK